MLAAVSSELAAQFVLFNFIYLWCRLRFGLSRRGTFMTFAIMAFSLFIVLLVLIFFSKTLLEFISKYFNVAKEKLCENWGIKALSAAAWIGSGFKQGFC